MSRNGGSCVAKWVVVRTDMLCELFLPPPSLPRPILPAQRAENLSSSAVDEISGEPVAIKMVTRATEKIQLAKRVLREITLLRHFNHENITGLIDVDCTPDLSEM